MKNYGKNHQFKFYSIMIFLFLVLNCSTKKYVIYNAVTGTVVDFENGKPLKDVKIFVDKFASNDFDTIKTNQKGYFFIDGFQSSYKYLNMQAKVSYNYHIEKSGYKTKIVTIKNLIYSKDHKLDTIKLKEIILTRE